MPAKSVLQSFVAVVGEIAVTILQLQDQIALLGRKMLKAAEAIYSKRKAQYLEWRKGGGGGTEDI